MTKKTKQSKVKQVDPFPTVTICTPTFNRRPFIEAMIECVKQQVYPKDKMDWIIYDDGTDKIEDIINMHLEDEGMPKVTYISSEQKCTLGKKRNVLNGRATGDIIVYMDDDDYYPPTRVSHAVETLNKYPEVLCVGSSAMFIYFKHVEKMYQFGPYGEKHATAATFAFRKKLLGTTKFDESAALAEEKYFLKNYTVPFMQLDSEKTILVISHSQNTFDKRELLSNVPNDYVKESLLLPRYFIKDDGLHDFYINRVDELLLNYAPGRIEEKPDVLNQIREKKEAIAKAEKVHRDSERALFEIRVKKDPALAIGRLRELEKEIEDLKKENESLNVKIKAVLAKCVAQCKDASNVTIPNGSIDPFNVTIFNGSIDDPTTDTNSTTQTT